MAGLLCLFIIDRNLHYLCPFMEKATRDLIKAMAVSFNGGVI